jgi:hypothetical protein
VGCVVLSLTTGACYCAFEKRLQTIACQVPADIGERMIGHVMNRGPGDKGRRVGIEAIEDRKPAIELCRGSLVTQFRLLGV